MGIPFYNFFSRQLLIPISLSVALPGTMTIWSADGFISRAKASAVYVKGPQIPGFADVVNQVKPAVVSVQVKSNIREQTGTMGSFFGGSGIDQLPDNHPFKRFFREFEARPEFRYRGKKERIRPVAQGSGFFTSEDGYIVTNNHVVAEGTSYIIVMDDGTELEAKLVGTDQRTDLAVLKIHNDAKHKFTYVDFADDNEVYIGDWVVAVGNPFGLGGTVTAGIVSARGRDIGAGVYDDFIQIDAAVNRGNSGGPTFNLHGQVVGINTAIFSPSGGSVGIAFSIPASTAKQVVRQLIDKGVVERGWLGVQIQPVTKEIAESVGLQEPKGAMIADPMDGPAAKAGIRAGNVIVSVNGTTIADARDLARRIASIKPGDMVKLGVWRNGKKDELKVKVAAMPDQKKNLVNADVSSEDANSLEDYGLTVTPAEDSKGVVVTNVDLESDAADKGLRPGDIIRTVNNKPVVNAADIVAAINAAVKEGRSAILMQVETNEQNHFVALSIQGTQNGK
ncbi:MAG: serine protease Do [Candidatus Tokpelaia sp. JSC085]|nr:MAG: serine protease Do [Candidatus Tokpelaia sp. JSC085]